MSDKLLIVDDESDLRAAIAEFLKQRSFEVAEAGTCKTAVYEFRRTRLDAVVLDYSLPDGTALDVLRQLQNIDSTVPVIILTGHGSIDLAVTAVKMGAEQFLTKPFELSALAVVVERAIENQRNRQKHLAGTKRQAREKTNPFTGSSRAIQVLSDEAMRIATADCPVLILGETGSGKGVLARWLHDNGPRTKETFVDVNCAGFARELLETELFGHEKGAFTGAITTKQGLFEVAHRGTIFLDEIGDMDLQLQPKLLKVLEQKTFRRVGDVRDHQIDTRVIAATHRDLAQSVTEKKFRADLYYRINTVVLRVPPLRERLADIGELAIELLQKLTAELGRPVITFNSDALDALRSYAWPGNVRELRNVIERALLLSECDSLGPCHLRFDNQPSARTTLYNSHLTLEQIEALHIQRVLAEESGHVERAAGRLGIPRSTLYQKLRTFRTGVN
jgi:DNA-binding NtrC family response regulator